MPGRGSSATLNAEVVLRAKSEPALGMSDSPPAHRDRRPAASLSNRLRDLGFDVLAVSPVSISIRGPAVLFQNALGGEAGGSIAVPAEWRDEVEGIYVQPSPEYFDR